MDFPDEVAAYTEVPAGGAACAYAACLGLALIHKAVLFELNRKELDPAPQAGLRIAKKEIERLYLDLKRLIEEDVKCYLCFSGSAKSGDSAKGKSAFLDVMTCSMLVMEKAHIGLDWAGRIGKIASPRLLTHLRVSAELLAAGSAGTAHVVRENIKALKSLEKQKSYLQRLETVHQECQARKEEVLSGL